MTPADPVSEGGYWVEIPDVDDWRHQIKCQDACPVHTDARGYVRAIAEGDHRRAYLIAGGPNPPASICGRICGIPQSRLPPGTRLRPADPIAHSS